MQRETQTYKYKNTEWSE